MISIGGGVPVAPRTAMSSKVMGITGEAEPCTMGENKQMKKRGVSQKRIENI